MTSKGAIGAFERAAKRLDGAPVRLADFREFREIMDEGRMDHAVARLRAGGEVLGVRKVAPVRLGAHPRQGVDGGVVSRETQHFMPRFKQLNHDS